MVEVHIAQQSGRWLKKYPSKWKMKKEEKEKEIKKMKTPDLQGYSPSPTEKGQSDT